MPTIRRAVAEDLEEVIRLRVEFILDMHPERDQATVLEITRQYVTEKLLNGELLIWFAEENGQIVGTSGLVFLPIPGRPAYVLNMYTLPEWRRQGIASLLLQYIIEYVKTTSTTRITLLATEIGRPVYERFGFVPSTDEMELRVDKQINQSG